MAEPFQSIEVPTWIKADDAVDLIAPILNGFEAAKSAIISGIKEGVIGGIADYILQEADIGLVDFDAMEELDYPLKRHSGQSDKPFALFLTEADQTVAVPDDFMASAPGWTLDTTLTSWIGGRFVARRQATFFRARTSQSGPTALTRRVISQIKFRRQDILRLLNLEADQAGPVIGVGNKRGPKPKDSWALWIAEVALMAANDEIKVGISVEGLIEKIATRLAEKGLAEAPSRSRTYSAAQAVFNALVANHET
jgi:hypothetical protein